MADERDHPIDEPSEISRSVHGRQRRGFCDPGGRRRDGRTRLSDRSGLRPLGNPVATRPGIVRGTRGSVGRGRGGPDPPVGMGLGNFGGRGGNSRRATCTGFSDQNHGALVGGFGCEAGAGYSGLYHGGATVGRRAPGSRRATTGHSEITVYGLPQLNIPTPSGKRSGNFDMSGLWSALPHDTQP